MNSALRQLVATLTLMPFLLLACADTGEKATEGTQGAKQGGEGSLTAVCQAEMAIENGFTNLFNAMPELEQQRPGPEVVARMQTLFDRTLAGPLRDVETNAPTGIRSEVTSAVAAARTFRQTGDASVFEQPPLRNDLQTINRYLFERCEHQKGTLSAEDYRFEGPAAFTAGDIRIRFTNRGKERHHMVVLGRKQGVTESFDQLLAPPEQEASQKVEEKGGSFPVDPRQQGYVTTTLTPGDYLMVCFLPQGSTEGREGNGPPHFALGMKQEFRVS